ncbi:AAA family ATPase [Chloroflexota bacterium]
MINIEVCNCNNINAANVQLQKNHLNIRYAMNGIGKSTIALAIEHSIKGEPLSSLKTFGSSVAPTCNITGECNNVLVFNEQYVKNFVLQESEAIPNSFDVFIKTPQYDEKSASIDNKLKNIHLDSSKYKDDFNKLISACRAIIFKLPVTTTGALREGGTYKSLKTSLSPYKVPKELLKFRPLMERDYTVNWVAWKHEGSNYDSNEICPFCSTGLESEYNMQKRIFTESYAKADVRNRMELLTFVRTLDEFMEESAKATLYQCIQGLQDDAATRLWIANFRSELAFLVEVISKFDTFNPHQVRIDNISKLDEQLTRLIIDTSGLQIFNSKRVQELFESVNASIRVLQKETQSLKREIGELTSLLVSSCKNARADINNFLETAGINYIFDIFPESEGVSRTILKYNANTENPIDVDNIREHLSWGERNAFALVLFMHDALSKNPELIILDDPISSFDSNKKFAIIDRLFSSANVSFKNKTVLMLTHDLQPIIDFIKVNKPKDVSISAYYLQNKSGVISEHEISYDDIKSVPKLLAENSKTKELNIVHRVASLRKLLEHSPDDDETSKLAYHILASLLHGKPEPDYGDDTRKLTTAEVASGETFIKNYIDDFNYSDYINNIFTKDNLLQCFKEEGNPYVQLQIFRVLVEVTGLRKRIEDNPLLKYIDEQFHVENDYMFSLDLLKYDIIPDSFIPKCIKFLEEEHIVS